MRYPIDHKARIHEKIVGDASRRMRARGLNGTAVPVVMRDAGLTHGGFYRHFESKDQLVLESLHAGFLEIGDRLAHAAEQAPPGEGWRAIVEAYLSLEHCDDVAGGCPLAALAPELARGDQQPAGVSAEMIGFMGRMLPFIPGDRPAERERAFFMIFSTMIGALQIARLIPRPETREAVLAAARELLLEGLPAR